ncbi:hypothetical protein INT47_012126 [Mucor saturninus]|uniref:Uncharacterized protein n=1 Tax=Mucor saturninus TaxID=64648 RepID=A0A8H7QPZ1_9FUNG|nr:hypothetical protein INT47_012126 [Mucor saturninus]
MNRKSTLYSILCIALILFVGQSSAIVRTEEVNDWSTDSLGTYFEKYNVFHDKKNDDQSWSEMVNSYKDAIASNSRIFGSGVDKLLSGFTNSVGKQTGLAKTNVDSFVTDLKHQLRQLELKGQLSKDRVQAVLDKAHHQAIRQKIMTESEWNKAYSTLEASYQEPSWYQRVLRLKPNVEEGSSSFNNWLQSVVDRVANKGGLTKEQTKSIADQLRSSISNTDISRLGDKSWLDEFTSSISKHSDIKKEKLDEVIESIKKDVNGYKVFALDYTGQKTKTAAKNWCQELKSYLEGIKDRIYTRINYYKSLILSRFQYKHHEVSHEFSHRGVTDSIKSVAHSLTSDWEASSKSRAQSRSIESVKSRVSGVADQVTSAAHHHATDTYHHATDKLHHASDKISNVHLDHLKNFNIKDSFAQFWRNKEHDAYRKLGYTEAHIDWIQDYLSKTFKDQKTCVRGKSDEAAIALKRYLNALHVQPPNQVDATVHKLMRHLESWRTLVN